MSRLAALTGSDGRVAPLCKSGATNPALSGAIRDDYPYRGATSGVDRWNSYKGQCTSFAAWRVNHNLGIGFHNYDNGNHVLPDTYSHRKATRGEGSHQLSEFIHFRP